MLQFESRLLAAKYQLRFLSRCIKFKLLTPFIDLAEFILKLDDTLLSVIIS